MIDFGDRVLSGNFFGPVNQFDTTVYLQNVSEDVVNIYDFPKRIQDTDRFFVTMPVVSTSSPRTIGPGALDSMTIQFYPHEVNRRMHTQITAKTDHLRAYVVDVYGRGVQDEMGVFADTTKVIAIDTLDFGLFSKTDPPADSEVFLGNAGTALLQITNMQVTGEPEFTKTVVLYNGAVVGTTLNIPEPPSGAARINLRFDPTGQPNGYHYATLTITSSTGPVKIVVLKARVETITPLSPSVTSVSYGPTRVCDDSVFTVSISNAQNGLPVTLTDATIVGTNAGDFALATKTPLKIDAGGNANLQVFFSPIDSGVKAAKIVLHFDLPKNAPPDTIQLSGSASKRLLEFSAGTNIHSYATDDFLVPIYAKTDITPFKADGYIIYLTYDTVNLRLLDIITNKTLTPTGYPSIFTSKPPGHDTIIYQQGSEHGGGGAALVGGGAGSLPLVYLKFRPELNGADAKLFQKDFHIAFKLLLNNSQIADACVDRIFDTGYVQVVSVCSPPFLSPRSAIPSMTALEQPTPNPFSSVATVGYDVADELPVRIQVVDASGVIVRTLVDEVQKPGYGLQSGVYLVTMDAGDYHRARRVVLGK